MAHAPKLIKDEERLLEAIRASDDHKVKRLLKKDPSLINTRYTSIIHTSLISSFTVTNKTPLMLAAAHESANIVRLLLNRCAPALLSTYVNERCSLMGTALMYAAEADYVVTALVLLKKGADINAVDIYGRSALIHAAICNAPHVTDLLLRHGADITLRTTKTKSTAVDFAVEYGHHDIVKSFKRFHPLETLALQHQTLALKLEGYIESLKSKSSHDKYGEAKLKGAHQLHNILSAEPNTEIKSRLETFLLENTANGRLALMCHSTLRTSQFKTFLDDAKRLHQVADVVPTPATPPAPAVVYYSAGTKGGSSSMELQPYPTTAKAPEAPTSIP